MNKRRPVWRAIRWLLIFAWLAVMVRETTKPMPPGTDVSTASSVVHESQVEFLYDLTYPDPYGHPIVEQHIFDAVLQAIDQAQQFVVLDFFLLNDDMGQLRAPDGTLRPLSRELVDQLLARKRAVPNLKVLLITDPINDLYGGRPSPLLAELQRGGIDVVRTDLTRLRDSNPAYSALWRMFVQWFGNSPGTALPDPLRAQGKVSVRSWLALLNLKANHRKVLIADAMHDGHPDWVGIITSANPHDASSRHSNVAWRLYGDINQSALNSELQVARFSGYTGSFAAPAYPIASDSAQNPTQRDPILEASYVTEQGIRDNLLAVIERTASGDRIDLAEFYLSERHIVNALLAAAQRGVKVRLVLDPNKDAFGITKDGVPNRPVANELVTDSKGAIEVRWYRTQGEQFHTKLALIQTKKQLTASLGSANLTRRNLDNYNLEANLQVAIPNDSALAKQLTGYFDLLWNGDDKTHTEYTAPFGAYKDDSPWRYWRYRFMEATGIGSF